MMCRKVGLWVARKRYELGVLTGSRKVGEKIRVNKDVLTSDVGMTLSGSASTLKQAAKLAAPEVLSGAAKEIWNKTWSWAAKDGSKWIGSGISAVAGAVIPGGALLGQAVGALVGIVSESVNEVGQDVCEEIAYQKNVMQAGSLLMDLFDFSECYMMIFPSASLVPDSTIEVSAEQLYQSETEGEFSFVDSYWEDPVMNRVMFHLSGFGVAEGGCH